MRICPRCTKVLVEKTVAEITVEGCPECGGAWFDKGELDDVAKRDPSALGVIDDAFAPSGRERTGAMRDLRCPVCLARLDTFEFKHFPGITLDGCGKCRGIWAEDGELRQIAERIKKLQSK